jgi:hypothetical protein
VNDLTTVELLWLEKRIENRIRFGRAVAEQIIDRRRRILSFAPGTSLRSYDGHPTILAQSSPVSTSCAQRRPDSAIRRCHGSSRAVTFCYG